MYCDNMADETPLIAYEVKMLPIFTEFTNSLKTREQLVEYLTVVIFSTTCCSQLWTGGIRHALLDKYMAWLVSIG